MEPGAGVQVHYLRRNTMSDWISRVLHALTFPALRPSGTPIS